MNINEIQNEIINEFKMFDDWTDKYSYIIELGKNLPLINENMKTEEKLVKGCQSKVWLDYKIENENIIFFADSDAIIVKGIVSLLIRVLSNQPKKEVENADLFFIKKIGLDEHLSMTRSNGLVAMISLMKNYSKLTK